ncbi:MAG: ester cyclase [Thermomicrobiales bacterium]
MTQVLASLRVRFVALALLAVLPALGLLFYTLDEQRDQAVTRARDEIRRLANLAASEQSRRIDATRQLLLILSELPQVRAGDSEGCGALMSDLLADNPRYANVGSFANTGAVVCSGVDPPPGANVGGQDFFVQTFHTGEFVVSDYERDVVTGAEAFIGSLPMLDENETVIGVVYAALDLDDFLAVTELPEDGVLTIVDRQGHVLARNADFDDWSGALLTGTPLVDQMLAERRGETTLPNEEGEPVLYAFAPLGGDQAPYAYLSVGIPRAAAIDAANRAFNDNLTWLGLVTALALVAAWVGGDLLAPRDIEANKELVRRVYEAFRMGNVDQLDEVVAPAFVDHDPMPGQAPGLVGLKQAVGLFRAAFPDGDLAIEELIAEDDKVVARVTMRGTQAGEFYGMPATGELVRADGVDTYLIQRGKIIESWSRFGRLESEPGAPPPIEVAEVAQDKPATGQSQNGNRDGAWWQRPGEAARALRRIVDRRLG